MSTEQSTPTKASSHRKTIIQTVIGVVMLVLIFGFLLPRIVDYGDVWDALRNTEVQDLGLIAALAIARLVAEAGINAAVLPGLSIWKGGVAFLASSAAAYVIPGPVDVVIRFGMYRSWGFPADKTTLAVLLSFISTTMAKAVLPAIALVAFLISGRSDPELATIAIVSGAAVIGVAVGLYLLFRYEEVAKSIGRVAGRVASWVGSRIGREIEDDFSDEALSFRNDAGEVVSSRWHVTFIASMAIQLSMFGVLLASLRGVGVTSETLSGVEIFAAFALVQLITTVPITPGGLGIAEVAYVSLLAAQGNEALAAQIAAGILIYRIFTWFIVIPLGGLAWIYWTRSVAGKKARAAAAADAALEDHQAQEAPPPPRSP